MHTGGLTDFLHDQREHGIRRRSPTSGTLRTLLGTPKRVASIRGHRPTQAKTLSLGEYVFLTDITFMFTQSCQLSVFILFHCTIHASLFSLPSLLLVCLKNLKKNKKKQLQLLASLLSMHVVVIKRTPKKISHSYFACWELSRVNSFISISFLWGSKGEGHDENVEWLFYALFIDLTKSPYYLVFSLVLNACRFQLSPTHMHYYYYYPHHSVMQVKGNNDDI